jgi:hypothetical protein
MGVIPTKTAEEITFGEVHAPVWAVAPTSIGLSAATCTAISAAVAGARKAFTDAQSAREASKAATNNLNAKMALMHPLLADAVQTIRLFAESTNNPSVYTMAQIPAPASPTPAPPPMQPVQLGASIVPGGTLRISFKATDTSSSGSTTYLVSRKLASQTAFTVIGSAGTSRGTQGANLPRGFKFFDDVTLPSGSNNMQYMVQGQRGSVFGMPSETLTVTIGVDAGGGAVVTGLKMAA